MNAVKLEIVASIWPEHRSRLDAIVIELYAAGVTDIETSVRFGLVMGVAEAGAIARLACIDGVKSIRKGEAYEEMPR